MNWEPNIDDLKVGDKVFVSSRHGDAVQTVVNVTKQHIIVGPGSTKYRRTTGRPVGADTWDDTSIRPATDEDVQRLQREAAYTRAIRRLDTLVSGAGSGQRLRTLPIETLTQAISLLETAISVQNQ